MVFPGNGNPIMAQTLAKGNFLADLTSASWVSEFNDANKAVMGAGGKILMGANNFTIIPALYNSQALKDVGATPPTTFLEVLQLCATAKAADKVAYSLAGLAGGNYHLLPYALTASLCMARRLTSWSSRRRAPRRSATRSGPPRWTSSGR